MDLIYRHFLAVVRWQLFGGAKPPLDKMDLMGVLKEARAQTVFTTVFPFLRNALRERNPAEYLKQQEIFLRCIMQNTNNFLEHGELHRLMTQNGIPYCTLKGMASARYYPDPSLREMGDVDYYIREQDFERAKQLVLSAGFEIEHGDDGLAKHLAFHRDPISIWEQHRSYDTPAGAVGERIQTEIDRLTEASEVITLDGVTCRVPDAFHHGLIMLLHVIAHMTGEGIGVRHLCDWAVFVNTFSNDTFATLFETKLKSYGLWRFAQILTMVSERYLGIAHKAWAQASDVSEKYLEGVMEDILRGGNFGKKDMNRYREIKYIANRGKRTVDNKPVLVQVFSTLNQKTYADYQWLERHKLFLPIGWLAEGGRYAGMLLSGKRKSKGTSSMLTEASKRKAIYSKMNLFETE